MIMSDEIAIELTQFMIDFICLINPFRKEYDFFIASDMSEKRKNTFFLFSAR